MTNPKHTDTSRSGDLVERLRRTYPDYYNPARASTGTAISPASMLLVRKRLLNPDGPEAADHIEALEAEVERLREELAAAYIKLSGTVQHASDCATSNAPAMKPGPRSGDV